MAEQATAPTSLMAHGQLQLPSVVIDSYNVELEDDEGFIGDRVNKGSLREFLENWRKPLRGPGSLWKNCQPGAQQRETR